jgi:hypothetical protein
VFSRTNGPTWGITLTNRVGHNFNMFTQWFPALVHISVV